MNSLKNNVVDIHPGDLMLVQDILRRHLPAGFCVWVFGSRAQGTAKNTSDLDLALAGPVALGHTDALRLEIAFEESNLPYTVDLVDLAAVSDSFRQIVERQKTPLPK